MLPLMGADSWHPASFTELAQNYLRMKRSYGGKIVPGAMDSAVAKHLVGSYGGLAPRVAIIAQVLLPGTFAPQFVRKKSFNLVHPCN
jgi:glycerol-3-phosphate dehydrogenase